MSNADYVAVLRISLADLLDCLERGDGERQWERMQRAGQILGLERYESRHCTEGCDHAAGIYQCERVVTDE